MNRLAILVIALATVAACGQKHPATTPSNTSTSAGSAAAATPTCCCDHPGEQSGFDSPDACKASHGTCGANEDNCHGIDGPIPDGE